MKWFKKGADKPKDWKTWSLFGQHSGPPMFALVRPALLRATAGVYQAPPPGLTGLEPFPSAIAMADGCNFLYTDEFLPELALVSIDCVTNTGHIQDVNIRKHYLGHAMVKLAGNLNMDVGSFFQSLVDGKRAIVAAAMVSDPPKPIYASAGTALELATKDGVVWYHYRPLKCISSSVPSDPPPPVASGFILAGALGPLKTTAGEYFFPYMATTTSSDMDGVVELEGVVEYCHAHNLSDLPVQGRERWCADFLRPAIENMQARIEAGCLTTGCETSPF